MFIKFVELRGHIFFNKFVEFRGTHFSTNHMHPHENKLSPSPCQSFRLLLQGKVYTKKKLLQDKRITRAKAFILTFRYIDDVLSINNLDSIITTKNLKKKKITKTSPYVSFLDFSLQIDLSCQLSV